MSVATLSSDLWILDPYGPVTPTTQTGPVRQGLGKFGDGLFIEEATSNLETNPNFEAGLTGWATTGAATQAASTLREHSGSQSNRVTATAAGGGTQTSVTVVSGQPHSFSRYVWVESGSVNLVATVGATGTSTTITSATPGWQRLTLSNLTTTGTSVTLTIAAVGGAATFHVDDSQTEQKPYVTSYCDGSRGVGYTWTGTVNASTSSRAAGVVQEPIAGVSNSLLAVAAIVRVGYSTGAAQTILRVGTTNNDSFALALSNGNVLAQKIVAGATVQATAGTYTAGDLLVVALTYDGTTLIAYESRNGAAVTSASAASATTSASTPTLVGIGSDLAGAAQANSVIEQVLVYGAALTSAQITALAASSNETAFKDDSRIVLSAATGTVRGTTQAVSLAGTGSWRGNRKVPSMLEVLTATAANPDDDTATHKITVPAGSGIGQGDSVAYNPDGSNGTRFLISRVFTTGGDLDELYATNVL